LPTAGAASAATTVAGLAVFFGETGVDIYHSGTLNTPGLATPTAGAVAIAAGNKLFVAGGSDASSPLKVVNIYDATTGLWSTTQLPTTSGQLHAAYADGKVFFNDRADNDVDIYDVAAG